MLSLKHRKLRFLPFTTELPFLKIEIYLQILTLTFYISKQNKNNIYFYYLFVI